MSNYNFEIKKVKAEKSIDGIVTIEAICLQTGIEIAITCTHSEAMDKEKIKKTLIVAHNERANFEKNMIKQGDII